MAYVSQIKRVALFILMQPDVQKAIEFYQKLGLKLIFHLENRWAELLLGSIKIGLCPTSQERGSIHTGVVFEVDDLMQFYHDFNAQIPFITEPHVKVHGIMASIQDPGGNIIDLYQPTPEKVMELLHHIDEDTLAHDGREKSSLSDDLQG